MSQPSTQSNRESPPSIPRWMKVMIIILVLLVLLVITLHFAGINLGCPPAGSPHAPPGCPSNTSSDVILFVTLSFTSPLERNT